MITVTELEKVWKATTKIERAAWMRNVEANLDKIPTEQLDVWAEFLATKRGQLA